MTALEWIAFWIWLAGLVAGASTLVCDRMSRRPMCGTTLERLGVLGLLLVWPIVIIGLFVFFAREARNNR